jgi:uncharacterized protein (UPF0261 family)
MRLLKDPLEKRGFEVAVFHATGMGGMAFEALARDGHFLCVLDFALPELGNLMVGSVAHAGPDRLTNAGRRGIPQIVAPGCIDLIDFAGWQDIPAAYADRPFHAHNRLIKSTALTGKERRALIRDIAERLSQARGPVHFILPLEGIEEWDRPGQPAHDPSSMAEMVDEVRSALRPPVQVSEVAAHINDAAFAAKVLELVDG